jgi:hypothetical protein
MQSNDELTSEINRLTAECDGFERRSKKAELALKYQTENYERSQSELTKARELLNTLYGASLEMLRIAGIANQGSKAYKRAITNLHESVTAVAARQAAAPIAHNVDESYAPAWMRSRS